MPEQSRPIPKAMVAITTLMVPLGLQKDFCHSPCSAYTRPQVYSGPSSGLQRAQCTVFLAIEMGTFLVSLAENYQPRHGYTQATKGLESGLNNFFHAQTT